MLAFRRVLCPIDFSDASRRALDHAAVIARWYGARLTAMHVVSPPVMMPPLLFAEARPKNAVLTESEIDDIAAHVRAWLAPATGSGPPPPPRSARGRPAPAVSRFGRRHA